MTILWYGGFVWIMTWIAGMLIGYVCGQEEAKKKAKRDWYSQ